jgi:uncharacterized membrane protein
MSLKEPLIIILSLTALTVILVRLLRKVRKSHPDLFVHFYLGAIALKLMVSLGLLVVVLVRNPEQAVMYALVFLISYALATAVEVVILLRSR